MNIIINNKEYKLSEEDISKLNNNQIEKLKDPNIKLSKFNYYKYEIIRDNYSKRDIEKKKEQQNKHYQKYKEKYQKEQLEKYKSLDKITCECGRIVHPAYHIKHLKSKIHTKNLNKKIIN